MAWKRIVLNKEYLMKIFDCTTYHSEDLMLDVRFNILDEACS